MYRQIDEPFKADHPNRPIIILKIEESNNVYKSKLEKEKHLERDSKRYEIILEKFHPKAVEAEQKLIEIAEPFSITTNIQSFTITFYSLYTAMTLGWNEQSIVTALDDLAKNLRIPRDIIEFIHQHTKYFNRAAFYLENGDYYLDIEQALYDEIRAMREFDQIRNLSERENKTQDYSSNLKFKKFLIKTNEHFHVIQQLVDKFKVPVKQEYDYHEQNFDAIKKSSYKMKAIYQLYDHQKKALKKIFQNDKGHSGVVILPCGAGKTLLGINVALKVKKRTLIICDCVNSVIQWQKSFHHFTHLDKGIIAVIMRLEQEVSKHILERDNIIVITNVDMLPSKRGDMEKVRQLVWPLLIMDEVHGLPAEKANQEISRLKTHMKLGLTATPYRQDNKIKEIFYKFGPKLHESMIVDLKQLGYVSKIYCVQIHVGMYEQYEKKYLEYQRQENQSIMNTMYQMNPKKFEVVQYLIDFHRQRKDKILIFCEKINKLNKTGTLQRFAEYNKCPILLLAVDQAERTAIYKMFQEDKLDVIIFGQIADQALDLPSANVGIQVSFNFSSVRQEFQRMGRIQRKKDNSMGEYDCFFYTLVTRGTKEVDIQFERQISVINQGYPYEIISEKELKKTPQPVLNKILEEMSKKILENVHLKDEEDD